jgi:transcriptional regulator with XRE-family HTH domain
MKSNRKTKMKAELKPEFVELRATGLSLARIAERLSVSKTTLIAWERELTNEIAEARFLQMQSLLETYKACKAERVKFLGKMYERLTEELSKRDLSEVEPARLLEMLAKVEGRLESELSKVNLTISQGLHNFEALSRQSNVWNENEI